LFEGTYVVEGGDVDIHTLPGRVMDSGTEIIAAR
jgi:hypothetical protein